MPALKVVPLIGWTALSRRTAAGGRPARPGGPDLHVAGLAALAYGTLTAGIAATAAGFAASQPVPIAAGGGLLTLAAIVVAVSLSARPLRLLLHAEPGPAMGPGQPASRIGTNPAHDSRGIPRTRSSGPA